MMKEKHVPNYLWAEAIATTVYLINRATTKAILGKTPHEALTSTKSIVQHLRVFGCVAYAWIDLHQRRKLDAKAEKNALLVIAIFQSPTDYITHSLQGICE